MALTELPNRFVLGVDVGGGTIKAALYEVQGNRLSPNAAWQQSYPTVRGVKDHSDQIADIIGIAHAQAVGLKGTLAGIGIASPGRFRDGIIASGSNAHIGLSSNEFDGVHLQASYQEALQKLHPELGALSLHVSNDADAMLAGMVNQIMNAPADPQGEAALKDQHGNEVNKFNLQGRRVAVLGIGTGVGHAIADVGRDGSLTFVTDGHASKLMIKLDEEDVRQAALMIHHFAGLPPGKSVDIPHDSTTKEVMAEYLFCDPVIRVLAGVENGNKIDPANPRHREALEFAGRYMARTIMAIKSARSRDHQPENAWSERDRAEAAKTEIYLIGGGMGRGAVTGPALIEYAARELKKQHIDGVRLVQVPGDNPAMYQAAMLVPPAEWRAPEKKAGLA